MSWLMAIKREVKEVGLITGERFDASLPLATSALAYGGYHLYAGIDRRLGEGTLLRMLLSRDVVKTPRR